MKEIHFVTIATNIYIDYWANLIASFADNVTNVQSIKMHIFTDQPLRAEDIASNYPQISFKVYEIEPLRWPEATLFRFRFIEQVSRDHLGMVAYIDADMLISSDISEIFKSDRSTMAFVSHPGYWRPKKLYSRMLMYVKVPKLVLADIFLKFKFGGIGAWETRWASTAYVPRALRNNYVCGGFWFGPAATVNRLSRELNGAVNKDLENNIIAKWHDESQINSWITKNDFNLLDPEFCYVLGVKHLSKFESRIIAVDKSSRTR
jgi:hypothetical protein